MSALRSLWDRITGRTAARDWAAEFAEMFPGKCMTCSYYRYGVSHGHVPAGTEPPIHPCIERRVEISGAEFRAMGFDEDFHNHG